MFTPNGQKTFPGRVIAQAIDRDLAVVKIEPGNMTLPVAPIGRSSAVRVGDTILAMGNPFGLSQTVTSGIVSAVRGSIAIEGHQLTNLIQTDAPVNQGNSGGPLVNLRGEVIGINTAIYSPIQTHTGLGFAVPIGQAKEVFASYMSSSTSLRQVALNTPGYPGARAYAVAALTPTPPSEDSPVWLGINIQIMNDVIAEQLKVPVDRGILINQVYQNSPAATAGVQRGDVIIRFDGRRVTDETLIRTLLADKKPGDRIVLSVLRGRKRLNIKFKTVGGAWQAKQAALFGPTDLLQGSEVETGLAELVSVGLAAITITPELTFAYGLPGNSTGIIATETEGLALKCGMKDGDIIRTVNGIQTPDLLSFLKIMKVGNLRKGVLFSVTRKGQPFQVLIKERPRLFAKGL
jgi:serine protease Do